MLVWNLKILHNNRLYLYQNCVIIDATLFSYRCHFTYKPVTVTLHDQVLLLVWNLKILHNNDLYYNGVITDATMFSYTPTYKKKVWYYTGLALFQTFTHLILYCGSISTSLLVTITNAVHSRITFLPLYCLLRYYCDTVVKTLSKYLT